MKDGMKIDVEKGELADLLGSSDLVPEGELHLRKDESFAQEMMERGVDVDASFALLAVSDRRFQCQNYTIGFLKKVKVVYNDIQARPIMINHTLVDRAEREFRENRVYGRYEVEILLPRMDLFEYFRSRGAMAPYATPDRL